MDPMDELLRNRILAIRRVMDMKQYCQRDNLPSKVEEVLNCFELIEIEFFFLHFLDSLLIRGHFFFFFQGLFLGSLEAARNKVALKESNITHILTVAHFLTPLFPNEFVYKVINGKNFFIWADKNKFMVLNFVFTSSQASLTELGFLTLWCSLQIDLVADKEDTNLKQYFDECFDFIEEGKRKGDGVLVHCVVGKSRR